MFKNEDLVSEIKDRIDLLITKIKSSKILGKTNAYIDAEYFTVHLFREIKDIKLRNLNSDQINSETIDLINSDDTFGVQVTTESSKSKIDKTIKSYLRNPKCSQLTELQIFIFSTNGIKSNQKIMNCDVKVFTIYDFLNTIRESISETERFHSFITSQIDYDKQVKKSNKIKSIKNVNIFNSINESLSKYYNFSYIPKKLLCNQEILNTKVHVYDNYILYTLRTDNKEFYNSLKLLCTNNKIDKIKIGIDKNSEQITSILNFLNRNGFVWLTYEDKLNKVDHINIYLIEHKKTCNCIRCLYWRLSFKSLHKVLNNFNVKKKNDREEIRKASFFAFKINNYKMTFQCLEKLMSRSSRANFPHQHYFNLFNLKVLKNWLYSNEYSTLRDKIDKINIEKEVGDLKINDTSLELIKELHYKTYYFQSNREVDQLISDIENTKANFNKRNLFHGDLYADKLHDKMIEVFCITNHNYYFADQFPYVNDIYKKAIKGLLISYSTSISYEYRFKQFDFYSIRIILEHIEPDSFYHTIKDLGLEKIKINENEKIDVINSINNFFESFYQIKNNETIPFKPFINLGIDMFPGRLRKMFSNIMLFIYHFDFNQSDIIKFIPFFLKFIKTENIFQFSTAEYLQFFYKIAVPLMNEEQFKELVHVITTKSKMYSRVSHLQVIKENNTSNYIANDLDIEKIILQTRNSENRSAICQELTEYYNFSSPQIRIEISKIIRSSLSINFDDILFYYSVENKIINFHEFENEISQFVLKHASSKDIDYDNDTASLKIWVAYNFIMFCTDQKVENLTVMNNLSKIHDFYKWLINPKAFDYNKFRKEWFKINLSSNLILKLSSVKSLISIARENLNKNEKYPTEIKILVSGTVK